MAVAYRMEVAARVSREGRGGIGATRKERRIGVESPRNCFKSRMLLWL